MFFMIAFGAGKNSIMFIRENIKQSANTYVLAKYIIIESFHVFVCLFRN